MRRKITHGVFGKYSFVQFNSFTLNGLNNFGSSGPKQRWRLSFISSGARDQKLLSHFYAPKDLGHFSAPASPMMLSTIVLAVLLSETFVLLCEQTENPCKQKQAADFVFSRNDDDQCKAKSRKTAKSCFLLGHFLGTFKMKLEHRKARTFPANQKSCKAILCTTTKATGWGIFTQCATTKAPGSSHPIVFNVCLSLEIVSSDAEDLKCRESSLSGTILRQD